MARAIQACLLAASEVEETLEHIGRRPLDNLFLIDLVARFGMPPAPGEMRTEIALARRAGEIVGVVALRPSVVFDADIGTPAIEALARFLDALGVGLVKSAAPAVDVAWSRLSRHGARRAIVDRFETAYAVRPPEARLAQVPPGWVARAAVGADLEPLVLAARESLREESRPDPFGGDPRGFRRWVRGRVSRARIVERGGEVHFVGYADVRRPEGWLLQGIYTWPETRRRGLATAGTSDLCRRAFAEDAEHVQLAVVEGNHAARALYEGLGFEPFSRLRTILFT
jgi:ribosomal protein S18 acetylase RimI-like enzyme